jgi:hypothetical protein
LQGLLGVRNLMSLMEECCLLLRAQYPNRLCPSPANPKSETHHADRWNFFELEHKIAHASHSCPQQDLLSTRQLQSASIVPPISMRPQKANTTAASRHGHWAKSPFGRRASWSESHSHHGICSISSTLCNRTHTNHDSGLDRAPLKSFG